MKAKKLDKYSQLVKLGLTNHQALVYCALLEQGDGTVLKLSSATKLNRITVHKVVDELVSLGLVFNTVSGKRRLLSAAPPEALQNLIINQEKELAEKKEMTGDLINSLYQSFNKAKDQTDSVVRYYEGYKLVRELYDEILASNVVHAIVNTEKTLYHFPENTEKFRLAAQSGTTIYDLVQRSGGHDANFIKLSQTYLNYKYKFLPPDFYSKGAVDFLMYNNSLAIILVDKTPKAIVIKNEILYVFALEIYKILWKVAETK